MQSDSTTDVNRTHITHSIHRSYNHTIVQCSLHILDLVYLPYSQPYLYFPVRFLQSGFVKADLSLFCIVQSHSSYFYPFCIVQSDSKYLCHIVQSDSKYLCHIVQSDSSSDDDSVFDEEQSRRHQQQHQAPSQPVPPPTVGSGSLRAGNHSNQALHSTRPCSDANPLGNRAPPRDMGQPNRASAIYANVTGQEIEAQGRVDVLSGTQATPSE